MNECLYVGMSSGPIFELMQYARATKELWMSSYMFSRYSQHMVCSLYEKFSEDAWQFTLISPNVPKENASRPNPMASQNQAGKDDMRVGLYSDRIFFRIKTDESHTEETVREAVQEIIWMAKDMLAEVAGKITGTDRDECFRIISDVVYTCTVYRRAAVLPLDSMNKVLDELELFAGDRPDETDGTTDLFVKLFDKDRLTKEKCTWIDDNGLHGADISKVAGIHRSQNGYSKAQASKYYAVVVADGDGVGSVLGKAASDEHVQAISYALLNYAHKASQAVIDYSKDAYPVYFGGDDMEFFVPLFSEKPDQTVWTLLDTLDSLFHKCDDETGKAAVCQQKGCENCSVSAAVNIVYYKYPLNRAISETHAMLGEAKAEATKFNNPSDKQYAQAKNCIHVQLRKHSGQTSRFMVTRHEHNLSSAWKTVKEYFSLPVSDDLVHGIHHRLMKQQYILVHLLQQEDRDTRLDAWLKIMQEEYPVSADYIKYLKKMLCHMWDQRRKAPKAEEENALFLQDLDGVFRTGEMLCTAHRQKKKKGDNTQ